MCRKSQYCSAVVSALPKYHSLAQLHSSRNQCFSSTTQVRNHSTLDDQESTLTKRDEIPSRSYYVVDSFANLEIPGSGNPAAVVLLPPDFDEKSQIQWMRVVAKEFNLSETAFVWQHNDDNKTQNLDYNIRFYTGNGTEVDLCGHATLASASVLLQTSASDTNVENSSITFHAQKDVLQAVQHDASEDSPPLSMQISMNFPNKSLVEIDDIDDRISVETMLTSAFGLTNGRERIVFMGIEEDSSDILVHLTPQSFEEIQDDQDINVGALTTWDGYNRGVIVCCDYEGPDSSIDFCSRWFGPKAGIEEDPVTGSAHCTLAPYFASRIGRSNVRGKQMSSRCGIVDCNVSEDRVEIIGTAATTMSGSLFL